MTVLRSQRQKWDRCLHAKGVAKEQNVLDSWGLASGQKQQGFGSFSGEEPQTLWNGEGALRENPCHLRKVKRWGS